MNGDFIFVYFSRHCEADEFNCDSINYVQSLLMGLVFVTFSLEGDSLRSVAAVIFAPRRDSKDSNDLKKCWRKRSDQNHCSFWFFNNFGLCFCILCYTSGHGWEAATPWVGGWMMGGWMSGSCILMSRFSSAVVRASDAGGAGSRGVCAADPEAAVLGLVNLQP